MLRAPDYSEIWCARHQSEVEIADSRIHLIDLDLESEFTLRSLPEPLDIVIHFAGATHARDPQRYRQVNLRGTLRLAEEARALGCRRFVYISTRCATAHSGAYGESKLAAEAELKKLWWNSLLLVRPAEIYGGGGNDGIDRLIELTRRWHLAPMLFGSSRIRFAPLHIDDFTAITSSLITAHREGILEAELCGPEDLTGTEIAGRLARRFFALPIPLWWPGFELGLRTAKRLGIYPVEPDQLQRLVCRKTGSAKDASEVGLIRFMQGYVD